MNNHFNNLYGSGGCIFLPPHSDAISGSIGAAAGIVFQNLGRIYNKMGRIGLLGQRLGGAAGKMAPPIWKSTPAPPPQMAQKTLAPVTCLGEASGDALKASHIFWFSRCSKQRATIPATNRFLFFLPEPFRQTGMD
jgi:hypothetical protein